MTYFPERIYMYSTVKSVLEGFDTILNPRALPDKTKYNPKTNMYLEKLKI